MLDIKKVREEMASLHADASKFVEQFSTNTPSEDEQKSQDERFAKLEKLNKQLEDSEKLAKFAFTKEKEVPAKAVISAKSTDQIAVEKFEAKKEITTETFAAAINDWAANYGRLDDQYATITTASQSGIFLPKEVEAPLIPTSANVFREAIDVSGSATVALITSPTIATINVPVMTGAAGGLVAENASSETDGTPTLTESIVLAPGTYQSGSSYWSNQQLAAGTVDVNAILPVHAYEKELGLESAIAAAIIADSGITQSVTAAATTTFTFANLTSLNRKLPKRFDRNKVIILGDAAYAYAETLAVSTNGPLALTPHATIPGLLTFKGTPVLRTSYFQAMTTGLVVGCVISLLGFRLRDCAGTTLARYDQVPAKPNQTGFNLFGYHAYGYAPSAMAKFVMA